MKRGVLVHFCPSHNCEFSSQHGFWVRVGSRHITSRSDRTHLTFRTFLIGTFDIGIRLPYMCSLVMEIEINTIHHTSAQISFFDVRMRSISQCIRLLGRRGIAPHYFPLGQDKHFHRYPQKALSWILVYDRSATDPSKTFATFRLASVLCRHLYDRISHGHRLPTSDHDVR